VTLLREELRRVKADLHAANSKIHLKEKLAASAMAAQAAADACLKLADSRSAGLQQRIEELTRQIEQEDAHVRKGRESARRRIRYACWPWQRLRVISASSRARTWFIDQNGRLLPGTEALLQIRI
jgi:phage-related minor tail protein